jgi:hypothetical protein
MRTSGALDMRSSKRGGMAQGLPGLVLLENNYMVINSRSGNGAQKKFQDSLFYPALFIASPKCELHYSPAFLALASRVNVSGGPVFV